jgi:hypothetical protein
MKTIYYDSTNCSNELDILGQKFQTDKSPFNPGVDTTIGDRKGYTGFYAMLFAGLKNKTINFCEIGIADCGSTQMWENYFTNANLYAFDFDIGLINKCLPLVNKTTILETDVRDQEKITETFTKTGVTFDVIIDDTTHHIDHQCNVIQSALPFLKSNGILIVEDIDRLESEDRFANVLGDNFVFDCFVICHHDNNSGSTNDKLWYGVKK